jgi:hypothetical protein
MPVAVDSRGTGLYVEFLDHPGGSSSAVERQLPKLDVAGSIPVSRSIFCYLTRETLVRLSYHANQGIDERAGRPSRSDSPAA